MLLASLCRGQYELEELDCEFKTMRFDYYSDEDCVNKDVNKTKEFMAKWNSSAENTSLTYVDGI